MWGEGLLSYKRLMGMFCWMGSHFYGWIDCKGFAFYNRVTRMGSHICGFFGLEISPHLRLANVPKCLCCR